MVTKKNKSEQGSVSHPVLKYLIIVSSLGGLFVSLLESSAHGYSHWSKRFLYFTAQSNVWIGLTTLAILLSARFLKKTPNFLYILKYIFTISITLTGLVFCCLLAPFGPPSYHLWAFSSWLTHIFSPAFSILDFALEKKNLPLRRGQVWVCLIPPLFYLFSTMLLEALNVDFGRGVSYPYFFMEYRSPVGFFGFSNQSPYFAGTFYWLLLFSLLILSVGDLCLKWNARQSRLSHLTDARKRADNR